MSRCQACLDEFTPLQRRFFVLDWHIDVWHHIEVCSECVGWYRQPIEIDDPFREYLIGRIGEGRLSIRSMIGLLPR
jgi:hypothetical protein